jgi:hypothetical protein
MLSIPLYGLASFSEQVTLDGSTYTITFQWNSRGSFWSMTFADSNNTIILSGVKLVVNYELISSWPDRGLPPGELYILDPTGDDSDAQFDDFGNGRLEMIYVTEVERVSV